MGTMLVPYNNIATTISPVTSLETIDSLTSLCLSHKTDWKMTQQLRLSLYQSAILFLGQIPLYEICLKVDLSPDPDSISTKLESKIPLFDSLIRNCWMLGA